MYQELFDLKGKNAIVTGGTGLLGKRFCAGLSEFGANVAVIDLDQEKASILANELNTTYGARSIGIACDVSSPESANSMVERVVEEFGSIHIVHNNAASKLSNLEAFLAPFEEYGLDDWKNVMSVNIDGMFLVAQAAGKQMIRQGTGGSIIQTSSIYGIMGVDHRIYEGGKGKMSTPAVYSASKGAVVALSKYLATYWAKHGIRVNTLTPGGVENNQSEEFKKRYSARVPLGRMAKPDELVNALIFLASDASSYITGQNIIVDGGLNAW